MLFDLRSALEQSGNDLKEYFKKEAEYFEYLLKQNFDSITIDRSVLWKDNDISYS